MRDRCNCPGSYCHNQGIKVCERWDNFFTFLADMGERPTKLHTLDRIDRNGDYEPGNVRWATKSEQQVNRSIPKNNKSGYRGVCFRGHKMDNTKDWRAYIAYRGKRKALGVFYTAEEAALAYNNAALEWHGENAQLNEI